MYWITPDDSAEEKKKKTKNARTSGALVWFPFLIDIIPDSRPIYFN